mmetsp:Transcript_11191/g.35426  ORF Transcript_11191/g.35426 Transcript_11191/m.35426 type:complete len:821 (-) Transcript_11191:43-2505(-)
MRGTIACSSGGAAVALAAEPDRRSLQEELTARYTGLSAGLDPSIAAAAAELAARVVDGLTATATDAEVDQLAAETAAYLTSHHPDYSKLAARVTVKRIHNHTSDSFADTMEALANYRHPRKGTPAPLVKQEFAELARKLAPRLEGAMRYERDFGYDYFGLRTLVRSYLLGLTPAGTPQERPQHMLMRVALAVHGEDVEGVLAAYEYMSRGLYTHATPTLFNAGCPRGQLCSCFLLTTRDDSVEGIFQTLSDCALISRSAGGIGLSISHVRASGSYIRSTGGKACGLVPMLRVFDATARYVDQGGGKRRGAFAMYLEPWHADVFDFLELKRNHGKEEQRARDLFYALWVPDLFMRRVEAGGNWSLFCPSEATGLVDLHGDEFDQAYEAYEREGRAVRVVPAQQLWFAILESQVETGTPYMLYKDACNKKSNQKNLGTIRGSNLCTEIVQYTSADEVAVCNLASLALPRFVDIAAGGERFDLDALRRVAGFVVRSLDRVITANAYPLPQASASNMRHRPMGLGVQGLADVFAMLGLPFESDEARRLNRDIFEAIYFGALQASCELAAELGEYESYPGSPASMGLLQYDLWGVEPSGRWDWRGLKANITNHGLRNSLLLAPMPTASTAQILGNNECFEPYTSNLYARRTLAGEFLVLNPHLQQELQRLGLWSREIRDRVIAAGGSVQGIPEIPPETREVFRTAWEMKQKTLIDMAAERGAFIDQSQSLNVFLKAPTFAQLSSMHFYAWRAGLKTGLYYLRSQPAADAIKFTVKSQQRANAADSRAGAAGAPAAAGQTGEGQSPEAPEICRLGPGGPDCEACSG